MNTQYIDYINQIILRDPTRLDLLEFKNFLYNNDDIDNKNNMSGHLCAGTFVVDLKKEKSLLLFHPKLKKWMQAGGHVEKRETPLQTAIREMTEETGIELPATKNFITTPFDAGVHEFDVPNKVFHHHYDFRFLVDVDSNKIKLKSENDVPLKWFKFKDIPAIDKDGTLTRMANYSYDFLKNIKNHNHLKL